MELKSLTGFTESTDVANYKTLEGEYDDSPGIQQGIQSFVAFGEVATDSSGTFTCELALHNETTGHVAARIQGTGTIGARRANADGASGNYLAPIAWEYSQTRFVDAAGAGFPGGKAVGSGYKWKLGIVGKSALTVSNVTIHYQPVRIL